MISKNKKLYLFSLTVILAGLFFVISGSSALAAGCGENQSQLSLFSAFNPLISFAENTLKNFGYQVSLAAAPDPDFCGSDLSSCSGVTANAAISWVAAPMFTRVSYGESFTDATLCYYTLIVNGVVWYNGFTNSYTISSGLPNNTTYSWSVDAYYGLFGCSSSNIAGAFYGGAYGSFTTLNCAPINNASCGSINAPDAVSPGQTFPATVTMTNTGTKSWTADATPHNLGSQNPQDNTRWGTNRVGLPSSPINPGQSATFSRNFTAPAVVGTYAFDWKMVEDGIEWFGGTCTKNIAVLPSAPTNPSYSCIVPGNSVTLSWTASPGATYYPLRVDNTVDGWDGSCSSAGGDFCKDVYSTSYSFSSTPGATYSWWVHACNANGCNWTTVMGPNFTCTCVSNGCEANTCVGSTCNNGCIPNAAGTKSCACVPNSTVACGSGSCAGTKTCNASGTGYSNCSSSGSTCASATDCKNASVCDTSGSCPVQTNKANGTACTSDANSCTNDLCSAGTCTYPVISGSHKECSGPTCVSGVANTFLMCTDGCISNATCGGCNPATFNSSVSGIYNSSGSSKINSIGISQSYMVKCDFGAAGTPNIPPPSGCNFSNYSGTTAIFNCTAPGTTQILSRSCVLNNAAPDYFCSQNQSIGDLTVSCVSNGCEANTCVGSICNNGCVSNAAGTKTCPKYKCVGTSCVRDDVNGAFLTSNCDNACTATPKYKCVGTSCVRDDVNGTYSNSNCDNSCPLPLPEWTEIPPF